MSTAGQQNKKAPRRIEALTEEVYRTLSMATIREIYEEVYGPEMNGPGPDIHEWNGYILQAVLDVRDLLALSVRPLVLGHTAQIAPITRILPSAYAVQILPGDKAALVNQHGIILTREAWEYVRAMADKYYEQDGDGVKQENREASKERAAVNNGSTETV